MKEKFQIISLQDKYIFFFEIFLNLTLKQMSKKKCPLKKNALKTETSKCKRMYKTLVDLIFVNPGWILLLTRSKSSRLSSLGRC